MADQAAKTGNRAKTRAKTRSRGGGRLKRAVDRNTEAVERIHRAVAGFPLDVLEQVERFSRPVARVRKLQARSIDATYDLVRGIEWEVAEFARTSTKSKPSMARKRRSVRHAKTTGGKASQAEARAS